MRVFFTLIVGLICSLASAQTKADMQVQIDKQLKTIDSLKAVVANCENIVENRDRSIKILNEDIANLKKEIETQNGKIRQKNSELVTLRNYNKLGEARRMVLNNTKYTMTVPPGKHWVVQHFMGDYLTDLTKDSLGIYQGKEIHVFLKSINNVVLTDPSKNLYGPQVYSSIASNHTIQFPLILTEGTTLTVGIYKGPLGALEPYDGNVICSYFEKDN